MRSACGRKSPPGCGGCWREAARAIAGYADVGRSGATRLRAGYADVGRSSAGGGHRAAARSAGRTETRVAGADRAGVRSGDGAMTDRTLRWLASKSPSTRAIYQPEIVEFERWLGRRRLSAKAIEDYQAHLLVERGNSPATVERKVSTICSYAPPMVSAAVRRLRSKAVNPALPLSASKLDRILVANRNPRNRAMIECALAGLRNTEGCNLRPEDCRWATTSVTLALAARTLKLTGAAFKALRALRQRDGDLHPFVFHTCHGQLDRQSVADIITKAAKRAGLTDRVTWQRLRASGRVLGQLK